MRVPELKATETQLFSHGQHQDSQLRNFFFSFLLLLLLDQLHQEGFQSHLLLLMLVSIGLFHERHFDMSQ